MSHKVTKVTVTLKNGKTGIGKTIRAAIMSAADKSKCRYCEMTQLKAWGISKHCPGSPTGIHDFGHLKGGTA